MEPDIHEQGAVGLVFLTPHGMPSNSHAKNNQKQPAFQKVISLNWLAQVKKTLNKINISKKQNRVQYEAQL